MEVSDDSAGVILNGANAVKPTGISGGTSKLQITPPREETSSQTDRRLYNGARDLSGAIAFTGMVVRRRFSSLPNLDREPGENAFFYNYPSRANGRARSIDHLAIEDRIFLQNVRVSPWKENDENGDSSGSIADDLISTRNSSGAIVPDRNCRALPAVAQVKIAATPRYSAVKLGQNADESVLTGAATPDSVAVKRFLKISPDSDFGSCRKVSIVDSGSPELNNEMMRTGNWVRRIQNKTRISPSAGKNLISKLTKRGTLKIKKVKPKIAANLRSASVPAGQSLITNHLRRLKMDDCTLSTAPKWGGRFKDFPEEEGTDKAKAGGDINKPLGARKKEGMSRKKKSVVRHLEYQFEEEDLEENLIKKGNVLNREVADFTGVDDQKALKQSTNQKK